MMHWLFAWSQIGAIVLVGTMCARGEQPRTSERERPSTNGTESTWWSLRPLTRPTPPDVRHSKWLRNEIDAFILHRLEHPGLLKQRDGHLATEGNAGEDQGGSERVAVAQPPLSPAPPADKRTLIRRATFDLIGLPPTPEEIDAFLADDSPQAYERLVDRLLASPHYGERWGRHWLDVVRFGESDGFEHDKLRPYAWRYRDYVINSFNTDKPYTQFVVEQLAGDAVEPITREGIAATGFLVAGPWDEIQSVGASKSEMQRAHEEQMAELIAAVSQSLLGMTVNCSRCHDHKFDPLLQSDYYQMKAVFDGVDHGNRPLLTPAEQQAYDAQVAPLRNRIAEIQADLKQLRESEAGDLPDDTAGEVLVEGRFGKALDPRQGRVAAKPQAAYQRPPLTVECWAKLDSKAGFNILVANSEKSSNDHWELYTYAGSGEFSVYLPGYTPAEIKSGVHITDGVWHYVAMVFQPEQVRLFVDGKEVKQAALERRGTDRTLGPLTFGSYPLQKIGCDGLVDEVRIATVARDIDGVPGAPFDADQHTVGLWHFDDAERNTFADAGTLANAATLRHSSAAGRRLDEELKRQQEQLAGHPVPMTYAGIRRQPEAVHVLLRGDITKPGPHVPAAPPASIHVPGAEFSCSAEVPEAQRRAAFARWVAHPANPLTARVMVNRIWQYHFGRGLVPTPSDFGASGEPPSHPELLDWLAAEFIRAGWSVKHIHRLIMHSATYRQSSQTGAAPPESDSDNRLLWRFTPQRLQAEIVRDAMLAVSGELNRHVGGPSFRPFTVTVFNTHFYHLFDRGTPEYNRRTVYRINVNTGRSPLLDALECPVPSILTPRRRNTVTTLQALALMNNSFVIRQAERFADRVQQAAGTDAAAQIELAFRLALGRKPQANEVTAMLSLVKEHGLENACWVLLNSSEYLYVR